jgi:hypothetical protein
MRAVLLAAAVIATPAAAQLAGGVPSPFHGIDGGLASPYGRASSADPAAGASTGIVGGGPVRPQPDAYAVGARCGDGSAAARTANGGYSCAGRSGSVGARPGG